MHNALSIDVEDYFQVHNLESVVRPADWDRYPSRVEGNTRQVLGLLRETGTRATFFVLGWIAERYPHLVREIAGEGHEIACHGYGHQLVYHQTPQAFALDIDLAIQTLQRALGDQNTTPVRGYRAPSFTITRKSLWALSILHEHGFRYDSSIFPLLSHDRYGIPNADRFASRLDTGLWEVPLSTVRLCGLNWPFAGGGYFRLYPQWLTHWGIRRINSEGFPAVIYFHPWEFDPGQPHLPGLGPTHRLRHYINLARTESCLRGLLHEFDFAPISEVFGIA